MNALNTQYNKTVAAAIATILTFLIGQYGFELPTEVQLAVTTILATLLVWAVPNKVELPEPPDKVGVETIELRD